MPVNVRFDGDAANLQNAQQSVADGAAKIREEYKKLIDDAKPVERETKKVWEQARPPLEKYNDQIKKLDQLLKLGKITQDQHNAGIAHYRQLLNEAQQAQAAAFGPAAIAHLKNIAGATAAVVGVQTTLVAALREELDIRRQAGEGLAKFEAGAGAELAGIATSRKELSQLKSLAARFVDVGAAENREEAAQLVAELANAQLLNESQFFGRLGKSRILGADLRPSIQGIAALRFAFGDIGSSQDVLSKAAAANIAGSPLSTGQILQETAEASGSAKALGLTLDKTVATVGVLSQQFGTRAGDVAENLFASFAKLGLEGTLEEQVRQLDKMGLSFKELSKELGSEVSVRAFQSLKGNLTELTEVTKQVDQADEQRLINRQIDLALTDKELSAARQARTAEGRTSLLNQARFGTTVRLVEAVNQEFRANLRGPADRAAFAVARILQGAIRIGGGDAALLENIAGNPRAAAQLSEQTFQAVLAELIRLREISERQAQSMDAARDALIEQNRQQGTPVPAIPTPET